MSASRSVPERVRVAGLGIPSDHCVPMRFIERSLLRGYLALFRNRVHTLCDDQYLGTVFPAS